MPKDSLEAKKWYLKAYELALPAAKNGDNEAQEMLARICLQGLGDTNRIAEGFMWRPKAATGGNIHAQLGLGWALLDGNSGLERNEEEALKWLSVAGTRGHRVAISELVKFYSAKGDHKSAAKWLHMLAKFGERDAQSTLGQWYAEGTGVPKDKVEAYKWLSLAWGTAVLPNRPIPRDEWAARMARQDEQHALRRDLHGALLTGEEMERAKRKISDFKRKKSFFEKTKNP